MSIDDSPAKPHPAKPRRERRRSPKPRRATRRPRGLGPLQDLLLRTCPPDEHGGVSIRRLAQALGVTHQCLYRWIETDRLPAQYVSRLVELSDGRVAFHEFHVYVYR